MRKQVKGLGKSLLAICLSLTMMFTSVPVGSYAVQAEDEGDIAFLSSFELEKDSSNNYWGTGIRTGSEPFDDNDSAGNDSSNSNNVIRSYDTITYNVAATVQPHDSTKSYENGTVWYEVTFPEGLDVEIDKDAMSWVKSGTWSKSGNTYRFARQLPKSNGSAIPGGCTVPIIVRVGGVANGTQIKPAINAWVEGCDITKTINPDAVNVSAAPAFNVTLVKQKSGEKTLYDFSDRDYNGDKGSVPGYLNYYGLVLQLKNTNADKGIKGIEIPSGPISFDVELDSKLTKTGSAEVNNITNGYTPLLYDVVPNNPANGSEVAWDAPYSYYEYEKDGRTETTYDKNITCKNSGSWSAVQNGNRITFTVSDYDIDMNAFPKSNANSTTIYKTDDGKISAGTFGSYRFAIVQPIQNLTTKEKIQEEYNCEDGTIDITVKSTNVNATTVAGNRITGQTSYTDDTQVYTKKIVGAGNYDHEIFFSSRDNLTCGTDGTSSGNKRDGSDTMMIGAKTAVSIVYNESQIGQLDTELHGVAINQLVKFDDVAMEINPDLIKQGDMTYWKYNILYAAKPDKTGWNHNGLKPQDDGYDKEMKDTKEENLLFFKDLDTLRNLGYTCVGALIEYRGCNIGSESSTQIITQIGIKIKNQYDVAGYPYMITASTNLWCASDIKNEAALALNKNADDITLEEYQNYAWNNMKSYTNDAYQTYIKNFDNSKEYSNSLGVASAVAPGVNLDKDDSYLKAKYNESGYAGGETSGFGFGDTVFIVPYNISLSTNIAQKQGSGNAKEMFDIDNGERYVDYVTAPVIKYGTGADIGSGRKTTVTIVSKLPKGLEYVEGSGYWGGTYSERTPDYGLVENGQSLTPSIEKNEDGTTTVTWTIENVDVVNGELPLLHYSCKIGNENDPKLDIENGQEIKIETTISTTEDKRNISPSNNNISTVSFNVTKLASFNITKTGDTSVERFGTAKYRMTISNSGNTAKSDVFAVDTMPYRGAAEYTMNGSYTIKSMQLTVTNEDINNMEIYYTNDRQYKGKTAQNGEITGNVVKTWKKATITVTEDNKATITGEGLTGDWPVAWAFCDDTLNGASSAVIDIEYNLDGAAEGDVLYNSYSQPDLIKTVVTKVYSRKITGNVWNDINKDGIKDDSEINFSEIKVALFDEKGTEVKTTQTDSNGNYTFEKVAGGNYTIEFSHDDSKDLKDGGISKFKEYDVTKKNASSTTAKNSVADAVTKSNGRLEKAVIRNINMPTIAKMQTMDENGITSYSIENQNLGLFYNEILEIRGFQMNTDVNGVAAGGPSFRIVSRVSNRLIGSNNQVKKVVGYGTILTLEESLPKTESGQYDYSCLSCSGADLLKEGAQVINLTGVTLIVQKATDEHGKLQYTDASGNRIGAWDTDPDYESVDYWALTLQHNGRTSAAMKRRYAMRVYAIVEDENGNNKEVIYGKSVYKTSIYDIAKNLYDNDKMSTNAADNYIYFNVLNQVYTMEHFDVFKSMMKKVEKNNASLGAYTTFDNYLNNWTKDNQYTGKQDEYQYPKTGYPDFTNAESSDGFATSKLDGKDINRWLIDNGFYYPKKESGWNGGLDDDYSTVE